MELHNGVFYGELLKAAVEVIGIENLGGNLTSFHEIRNDTKLCSFALWAYENVLTA
jgi:hypothetical protein